MQFKGSLIRNLLFKMPAAFLLSFVIMGAINGNAQNVYAENYDVWVGGTQVTSDNKDNIPLKKAEGKAYYDPDTNTLTLEGNVIPDGKYENSLIYVGDKWTTKTCSVTIEGRSVDGIFPELDGEDYGIRTSSGANVTLKGKFYVYGKKNAISFGKSLICEGEIYAAANGEQSLGSVDGKSGSSITVNSGLFEASTHTETELNPAVFADTVVVNGGAVKICSWEKSDGLAAKNITINGGAVYAYSKKKYAVHSTGITETSGNIEINDGVLTAKSEEMSAVNAVLEVKLGSGVGVLEPSGAVISDDQHTIESGSTPVKEVVVSGESVHFIAEVKSYDLTSAIDDGVNADELLWNTLAVNEDKARLFGEKKQFLGYRYFGAGYDCLKLEKTESGYKIYPLGGKVGTYTVTIKGEDLVDLEYDAIKNNVDGEWYYFKTQFTNPLIYDIGEYEIDFIDGVDLTDLNSSVEISGGELAAVNSTLRTAIWAGLVNVEGELSDLRIDLDKDGTGDIRTQYDADEMTTTVTPLSGRSVKTDTWMYLGTEEKNDLEGGGGKYYSSIMFRLSCDHNKGEVTINLKDGSARLSLDKFSSIVFAYLTGRVAMVEKTDTSFYIDMDKDDTFDFLIEAASDGEVIITVLKGCSLGDSYTFELTDDEMLAMEAVTEENGENEEYYQKTIFIFKDTEPGEGPGEGPGEDPGEEPGEGPGEGPGEEPGEGPGEGPGEDPGEDSGEGPGEAPGENPGNGNGETPGNGENPGNGTGVGKTPAEEQLSRTISENIVIGNDTWHIDWNNFVEYDGRKHEAVGVGEGGTSQQKKESASKACDIKITIYKNGGIVDPSSYTVKTKNNKKASVSIDGITEIGTNSKDKPYFTISFKGKEFKDVNKEFKKMKFAFGIIPAELTDEQVKFEKVKKDKSGNIKIVKITFTPRSSSGTQAKTIKLKSSKKAEKTDYTSVQNSDGTVTVTGQNNFYGTVVYKQI